VARLHFDEDQRVVLERHQVELPETGARVAGQDPPAALTQPGGDRLLGDAAESLSGDGHDATLGGRGASIARAA
jgi:hypothetical protein